MCTMNPNTKYNNYTIVFRPSRSTAVDVVTLSQTPQLHNFFYLLLFCLWCSLSSFAWTRRVSPLLAVLALRLALLTNYTTYITYIHCMHDIHFILSTLLYLTPQTPSPWRARLPRQFLHSFIKPYATRPCFAMHTTTSDNASLYQPCQLSFFLSVGLLSTKKKRASAPTDLISDRRHGTLCVLPWMSMCVGWRTYQ